jgi:tRNA(fMet)-specific endonuclease VapC
VDRLRRTGQPVGLNDTPIAAIAQANDCSVLTDNMRDFERIPGLVVERPAWPE